MSGVGNNRIGKCQRSTGKVVREQFVAASHLPPCAARGELFLQSGTQGSAVRLFHGARRQRRPGPPGRPGLLRGLARHHRARDDACAARRAAPALSGADQSRRPRVSRSVRGHRRSVSAFHDPGSPARADRPSPRQSRRRQSAWRNSPCNSGRRRRAATTHCATLSRTSPRAAITRQAGSRTSAARSSSPPFLRPF